MSPTVTRCVACGLEGYDIAPRRGGRPLADGSAPVARLCRYCDAKPEVRAEHRREAIRLSSRESMRRRRYRDWLAQRSIVGKGVILGPCPCHDCKRPVAWNGLAWMNLDGAQHTCRAARRAA